MSARVDGDVKRAIEVLRDKQEIPTKESAVVHQLLRSALKAKGLL